ncbi:hypothetical protein SAMN05880590_1123 [Rhizobium sp. RU35A]|nr:hypothetical protein SAMN05880590_1123 [Rhizobium sp. RU35A]
MLFSSGLRIFLDAGVAFNDYVKGQPLMTYEDGGFGLDFESGGYLSGELSVAWPIDPNSNTQAVDGPRFLFFGDVDLLRFSHANQHRLQCPMINMRFVPAWRTPDYLAGIVVDVERVVLCSDSGVELLFFFRVIK